MPTKLPLLSAQFVFAMEGQRTGRRASVSIEFTMPPQRLSARDVDDVLQSVARTNTALAYRPRFARGTAHQEWSPSACDFGETSVESSDAARSKAATVISEFESDLDGAPMSGCLIRSPGADHLVIVLDHALVDEQSLLLICRQLGSPRQPDEGERSRFETAVNHKFALEAAAGRGAGIAFWSERLRARSGEFPQVRKGAAHAVPGAGFPSVTMPPTFRGSLFPYLLFSLHRAIRDTAPEVGSSIIGYPWGGRDARFPDLVGCFMNTAVSIDTTEMLSGAAAARGFRAAWFEELDHIDVPITALIGLNSGFSGAVTAYLSYTNAWARFVNIAGVEAVLVPPSCADIPVTATFQAAATVRDDQIHPWLFVDEHVLGCGTGQLGSQWCTRLGQALQGW